MRLVYGHASSVCSNTNRRSDEFMNDPDIIALIQANNDLDAEIDEVTRKEEKELALRKAELKDVNRERRELAKSCRDKDRDMGLKYATDESSVVCTIALLMLAHKVICSEDAVEMTGANAVDQVCTL